MRNSQKESAFSLGNAISGAPIWSGTMTFASPTAIGVPKSSSMIVPCIVKSWS